MLNELDTLSRGKGNTAAAAVDDLLRQFAERAQSLHKDMAEHLDGEEDHICPLMAECVDQAKVNAKETEIVQGLGLEGAALMLPWIVDAMELFDPTPDKRFAGNFYNNIPPPLRLLLWAKWKPAYQLKNRAVIESLAASKLPKSACC